MKESVAKYVVEVSMVYIEPQEVEPAMILLLAVTPSKSPHGTNLRDSAQIYKSRKPLIDKGNSCFVCGYVSDEWTSPPEPSEIG